ncbi:MAG: hypothetical protein SOY04_13820 [Clostridium celatum]|nr:hypothetical protein [Clostridium celatum]
MSKRKPRFIKVIKRCWSEISFKDKGLILIMIILIIQCIHNLYTPDPTNTDYVTVNVMIRTSVASIFGYFLSSNFLVRNKEEESYIDEENDYKFKILQNELQEDNIRGKVETEYDEEKEITREKERYFCNKTLQNAIAIILCITIIISLIIGVNFNIVPAGADSKISQFRDLISGCIGFLLGNSSKDKK